MRKYLSPFCPPLHVHTCLGHFSSLEVQVLLCLWLKLSAAWGRIFLSAPIVLNNPIMFVKKKLPGFWLRSCLAYRKNVNSNPELVYILHFDGQLSRCLPIWYPWMVPISVLLASTFQKGLELTKDCRNKVKKAQNFCKMCFVFTSRPSGNTGFPGVELCWTCCPHYCW